MTCCRLARLKTICLRLLCAFNARGYRHTCRLARRVVCLQMSLKDAGGADAAIQSICSIDVAQAGRWLPWHNPHRGFCHQLPPQLHLQIHTRSHPGRCDSAMLRAGASMAQGTVVCGNSTSCAAAALRGWSSNFCLLSEGAQRGRLYCSIAVRGAAAYSRSMKAPMCKTSSMTGA